MRVGIFWRIVSSMVLVSLLPLAILGFMYSERSRVALTAGAERELELNLEMAAADVEGYIAESVEVLRTTASLSGIISMNPKEQKPVLQAVIKTHGEMTVMHSSGLDGMNVTKNDDSALNSVTDRVWFQNVANGAEWTAQTVVSKTTGKPSLVVAVPIKEGSTLKGVLAATIGLKKISETVNAIKIGQTGFAWLVDGENKAMAHPDNDKVEKQASLAEEAAVKKARAGDGSVHVVTAGSKRWLTAQKTLPQGWVLVAQVEEAEALQAVTQMAGYGLTMTLIAAVVVLILAALISRSLSHPISVMGRFVERLGAGDFTGELTLRRRDELGAMALGLTRMQQALRAHVLAVKESATAVGGAGRDLTQTTAKAADSQAAIAGAFSNTLTQVERATGRQQEQLKSAKSAVTELVAAVDQIARTATHQAEEVSQASEVVAEAATQADLVTSGISRVAAAVSEAAQAGAAGHETIEGALIGIRSTNERVSVAAEETRELGSRSEAIQNILAELSAIADQTNLLALNAAIEAARAGEAGRGFAVVAEEVRRLADRSGHSAREISKILASLQEGVRRVGQAMDEGAQLARDGAERAGEAQQALSGLVRSVQASAGEAHKIEQAASSLTEAHARLTATFQTLAAAAEENSASAEEMAAGGQEVSSAIGELDSLAMQNFAAIQSVGGELENLTQAIGRVGEAAQQLSAVNSSLESSVAHLKV